MNLLSFIVGFPLLGCIILFFFQRKELENRASIISIGSIGISILLTILEKLIFFRKKNTVITVIVLNWINIEKFNVPITLVLDNLSLIMVFVTVSIGLLVCLYSSWYMRKEKNYARFFLYINLFITGMLILVLTNNLLIIYLGMELIGFCSYLLIGFYYENEECKNSSEKAFIFTKIGDILILFSIFIFYKQFGTLNYNDIISSVVDKQTIALKIAIFMFLIGSIGKSAQIPLHNWLPDAMSGPTPASALIHASTMITSGVYLVIRLQNLFFVFPETLTFIEITSIAIIVLSSLSAFLQTDIKKILAYSTMSQIGYMFLSISIRAFDAAIYHLFTHAFFKSLLFLASGSISTFFKNEKNINKICGIRKHFPFVSICFLIGSASLSSFPIITSGFYSKDEILLRIFMSNHKIASMFGLLGSFLTSIYVSRMIFFVLFKENTVNVNFSNYYSHYRMFSHYFPLFILSLFSTFFGKWIGNFLISELYTYDVYKSKRSIFELISLVTNISGYLFFFLYLKRKKLILLRKQKSYFLFQLFFRSFYFEILYNLVFVRPYFFIKNTLKIDLINEFISFISIALNKISENLFKVEKKEFLTCTFLIAIWSTLIIAIFLINHFRVLIMF